jgi:hypothetical protein
MSQGEKMSHEHGATYLMTNTCVMHPNRLVLSLTTPSAKTKQNKHRPNPHHTKQTYLITNTCVMHPKRLMLSLTSALSNDVFPQPGVP